MLLTSGTTDDEILRRGLFGPGAILIEKSIQTESLLKHVREMIVAGERRHG